jgi:TonB family protein
MEHALSELPELTRSRRFAPGIQELSLGTPMGRVCWQVQVNGGNPIDQYLCIDPTKGVIYVGTTGTNPPQKVPLSQWRATHTGFTFHDQPVLLPVEPLDPSKVQLPPIARVTDLTGKLTEDQRAALSNKLLTFEARNGSQIAVLMLPTTAHEDITEFGTRLFNAWKLGRRGIDDGAILIVAVDDHHTRIDVGRGLESAVTNAAASRLLDDMRPALRANDFFGGINSAIDRLIALIDNQPPAGAPSTIGNTPDSPAQAQARGQVQAQRPVPLTPSVTNAVARTPVKPDPLSPLGIGEDFYPEASKRANEEGRCVVLMTVTADGRIADETLQSSSGFPRLDEACLKAFHGRHMFPATENGKPVETRLAIPITWKLPQ